MSNTAQKPNLLLIDDSSADRRLSQLLLENHFHIRIASGGREARLLLSDTAANSPDLVLCDYRMPCEDGLQLFESLRGGMLDDTVPFVIMTAAGSSAMETQALESQVSAVLTKPIDPAKVVPQLQHFIELAQEQVRQRRQLEQQNQVIQRIEQELALRTRLPDAANTELVAGCSGVERFEQRLAACIAEQADSRWAALMIDINRYRDLVTGYGHAAARAMLVEIGQRLTSNIRESDLIGHIEPDVFLIATLIKPGLTAEQLEDYLLRQASGLIAAVAQPIVLEAENVQLTACAGIAHASTGGTATQLIAHATQALGSAKRGAAREPVAIYRPEQLRKFREEILLESQLRKAIRNGEIRPYFQPQFDLRTGALSGAEALARWRLADGSFVPPVHFIPVAESAQLISPLGELMLRQTAASLDAWRHILPPVFRMGINVSAAQFARTELRGEMLATLDRCNISPSLVELELTESIVVDDSAGLGKRLQQLSDDGFSIALDDFGTGYSSLSILRDLPFNRVKIDRSFIRDLPTSPKCAALLDAVITLGKSFGFDCIAEGIEDLAQQTRSFDLGVLHGQGFLYGRAVSAEDFSAQFLRPANQACRLAA